MNLASVIALLSVPAGKALSKFSESSYEDAKSVYKSEGHRNLIEELKANRHARVALQKEIEEEYWKENSDQEKMTRLNALLSESLNG